MQLQLNKENFNQSLNKFSTYELENLIEKFPYFQQAHLLLAKKYQQQNNSKFDQQLQLAALYTQDRELLFSLFNEKEIAAPVYTAPVVEEIVQEKIVEIPAIQEPVAKEKKEEIFISIQEETIQVIETAPEQKTEVVELETAKESVVEEIIAKEDTQREEVVAEKPTEEFSLSEPHTFDEWLHAFAQPQTPKIELTQQKISVEPEKLDEELEKLYIANIPVNLQELVEDETHYSKGLDKFIEEQIQKHKAPTVRMPVYENELAPELITETMARVYEMQKKYAKAIRCYEILALKYPKKNDFFAARINYLKNII